jgi:hypothetical protein
VPDALVFALAATSVLARLKLLLPLLFTLL